MKETHDNMRYVIPSQDGSKSDCTIIINEQTVDFFGDVYIYIYGDFRKTEEDIECEIKDFLGMGYLKKRSRSKLIGFFICGCLLGFADTISGKLSDYLPWINTNWTSFIVCVILLLSIFMLVSFWKSQKSVIEFSFLSKRVCVESDTYTKEDFNTIYSNISEQRKKINTR